MFSVLLICELVSQSVRETKAASHILQTVWAYKDLRHTLYKAGWNKTHFKVTAVKDGRINECFTAILMKLLSESSVLMMNIDRVFQPAVSGLAKKQRNTKQGNDDITLPLMEKNQGHWFLLLECGIFMRLLHSWEWQKCCAFFVMQALVFVTVHTARMNEGHADED